MRCTDLVAKNALEKPQLGTVRGILLEARKAIT